MKRINLKQGKYILVDDEDYFLIRNMRWSLRIRNKAPYAVTYLNDKEVSLHNFLINPPNGFIVDHKDGNGLNNARINLRVANTHQNKMNKKKYRNNTTGFKGVVSRYGITAQIFVNNKQIHLGTYPDKESAARAYDRAAIRYFGEFAKTNAMLGLLN